VSKIWSSISSQRGQSSIDDEFEGPVALELQGVDLVFPPKGRPRSLKSALLGRSNRHLHQGTYALRGIDIVLEPGDRLGVVGENGSGKTSLLQVMAGIYPPSAGSIRRQGSLVPLLQLGLGFNPELSGEENILLAAALLGIPRREITRRVPGILEFCELSDLAHMPLKYYSTGMTSRLAFAVATEIDADILLLDEVFAVGDIHWIERAVKRLEALLERVSILVVVSHSLDIIERLSNRCVLLDRGHMVANGAVADVVRHYRGPRHTDPL